LIVVEGLIDFIRGAYSLAIGHPYLGLVFIMFAILGSSRPADRAVAAGVVMVVVALLGILLLGFANGLIGLLGSLFVLIGGLLFLVAGR